MTTESGAASLPSEDRLIAHVDDQATRLVLLTRLVALLNDSAGATLAAELSPDLVDQLRTMRLTDAAEFTAMACGISIVIDSVLLDQRFTRLHRTRMDRALYEHFIRRGASPQLVGRLFSISQAEVRTARRLIAPEAATGGRPRQPAENLRAEIFAHWTGLLAGRLGERERYFQLSQSFPDLPIVALEAVIDEETAASK